LDEIFNLGMKRILIVLITFLTNRSRVPKKEIHHEKGDGPQSLLSVRRDQKRILMRSSLLEEVRDDYMIYHGYSGHFLWPTLQHFIRVRIDAPLDLRVKTTMERLNCDEKAVRDYITQADDERVRWARFMFARDLRDPKRDSGP
jgi:hypothetical protein